jgi:hypothetical protein
MAVHRSLGCLIPYFALLSSLDVRLQVGRRPFAHGPPIS